MAAVYTPTLRRTTAARLTYTSLLGLLAIGVFAVAFAMLHAQPIVALDRASGLYDREGDTRPFRWTSSTTEFPLMSYTGPTELRIELATAGWPHQPEVPVQLETDAGPVGTVAVTPELRRFKLLLPPRSTLLRLHAPVDRPAEDWRWLGVQVFSIDATPSGVPFGAALQALLISGASIVLAWALAWAARLGYGAIAALTLLGLGLRLAWLTSSPPLMHRDEVVSLVDAWSLARTAHDHLGHLLPIAAFEGFGDWISPMLTYLLLPWVALFGPQPIVARVVTAVFGALAIPAIYGAARELRMPVAAVCAAAVMAFSPWQIFLSRVAIPPALIATCWSLCLWAALRFVRSGRRTDAFLLAAAAGLSLYAYPTMKMAVPLLVLLAAALAIWRQGWRAALRWWLPAALLGVLWLPFVASTLFNPASGARLALVALKADSAAAWLASWWSNYAVYFQPDMYYVSGGIRKIVQGVPGHGLALSVEAIPLLGLLALPALYRIRRRGAAQPAQLEPLVPAQVWLLLLGALLIAPLPASLTTGNPHAFRAAPLMPIYAILVGVGAAAEWALLGYLPRGVGKVARGLALAAFMAVLAWQSGDWFSDLLQNYPRKADATWFFADREIETMQHVAARATGYSQVWLDIGTVGRPYIFLLAAQAVSPAEAQSTITIQRQPPAINSVTQMGRYHFGDFKALGIPQNLPALEALPTHDGGPGYLIQEWQHDHQTALVVRGMTTHLGNFAGGDAPDGEDDP